MRNFPFLLLASVVLTTNALCVQKQTISVIPEDKDSEVMSMLIEAKIADSGKLNIYYHFGPTDKETDRMKFMFDNKLSGLLTISNNTLRVFTTKGLLTNFFLTENNVEEVVSNIIEAFPPKEPEKIIKDITEIDYVSPLEETKPRHSLALFAGVTHFIINFNKSHTSTNITGGQTNISYSPKTFIQTPESRIRSLLGLGYGLDTRYFSLSLGISLEPKIDPSFQVELSGGFWFFKGFMMIGLGALYEHTTFSLSNFAEDNNNLNLLSFYSEPDNISLNNIYFYPIAKIKLSKNDILSFSPLLAIPVNIGGENIVIEDIQSDKGPNFIGITLSLETEVLDNVLLGFQIKIMTTTSEGYLHNDRNITFSYDVLSVDSLFLRYKF